MKMTQIEFAKKYNINHNTVRSHVRRGKLVLGSDNLLDSENPVNYVYIQSIEYKSRMTDEEIAESNHIEYRKKIATLRTKELESEMKKIQLEKIGKEYLPIDLVQILLDVNFNAIENAFNSEPKNISNLFKNSFDIDENDRKMIEKEFELIFIKILNKYKNIAMTEIANLIDNAKQ